MTDCIEKQIVLRAPIARVWRAVSESKEFGTWFGAALPERQYRWHPHAVDPSVDYEQEPTTLVTFRLEEIEEGTRLTVTESGFEALPEHRRADAFRRNEAGWASQLHRVERHVAGTR